MKRYSSRTRPLHRYEERMLASMVAFDTRHPQHVPWERLVSLARAEADRAEQVCSKCGRDRHGYKGSLCRYCAGEAE